MTTSQPFREITQRFNDAAERATTLYTLSDEFADVLRLIENAESEEDATQLEVELNKIAGSIQHKAENIAGLMQWCDGLADMRKAEAKRMAASAAVFEHRAERLREYMKLNMEKIGIERIDTARFTLKIRTNPPRVDVLNPPALVRVEAFDAMPDVPEEYVHAITLYKVDKRSIAADVKTSGEVVPGVEITRGTRLEVS